MLFFWGEGRWLLLPTVSVTLLHALCVIHGQKDKHPHFFVPLAAYGHVGCFPLGDTVPTIVATPLVPVVGVYVGCQGRDCGVPVPSCPCGGLL